MPLEFSTNTGQKGTMGPSYEEKPLPDGAKIFWSGDEIGIASVYGPDRELAGQFRMPTKGTTNTAEYEAVIRDIDGKLGSVKRSVSLERI